MKISNKINEISNIHLQYEPKMTLIDDEDF